MGSPQVRISGCTCTGSTEVVRTGCKVWVEVSKIGDASVWRPNSEIEYISDAIGTTVAWPNY